VHFPGIKQALLTTALTQFYEIRDQQGLKKKPSTSEVLDWLKLLLAEDLTRGPAPRRGQRPAEAARRASEERTGRGTVRTAGLHGAAAALRAAQRATHRRNSVARQGRKTLRP
jgi:MoxR-like ATPase